MKVHNINGTSQRICKCGSWLKHWQNYSGQSLYYCPVISCMEGIEVGAHVQKDSQYDRNWYIIPLCAKHNAATKQSLDVADSLKLVSANVSETCG